MKKMIALTLSICISLASFSQIESTPNQIISSENPGILEICNSSCFIEGHFDAKKKKVFLLSVQKCGGGSELNGDLFIELISGQDIFYTFLDDKRSLFGYTNEEIYLYYNSLSKADRSIFRANAIEANNDYQYSIDVLSMVSSNETSLFEKEWERSVVLEKAKEDSLRSVSSHDMEVLRKSRVLNVKEKSEQLIKKANGFILVNIENVFSEYGTSGAAFRISNCSGKRIKYVEFSLKALNEVGDQVGKIEKVEGIGFVEPGTIASWSFDKVWNSDVISSVRIWDVKVTYEDGTIISRSNMVPLMVNNEDFDDLEQYYQYKKAEAFDPEVIGPLSVYTDRRGSIAVFSVIGSDEYGALLLDDKTLNDLEAITKFATTDKSKQEIGVFQTDGYSGNIYIHSDKGGYTVIFSDQSQELISLIKNK